MLSIRSGLGIVCAAGLATAAGVGFMAGHMAPAPTGVAMAVAQPEGMDPEEMKRQYEEKNRTGEHHKWLEKCAGQWDAEMKFWMDPAGEPMESKGTEKNQMIFDGRYLKSEFSGEWMGEKFDGFSLMGYNNAEGRFESIWVDSSGTAIMFSTGERQGDKLTLKGEMKDCMSEQMVQFRHEMKFEGPSKRVFTGYHTMEGQEMKAMEIVYTKRGASMNGRGNDGNRGNRGG
jgi:hypothetical protein